MSWQGVLCSPADTKNVAAAGSARNGLVSCKMPARAGILCHGHGSLRSRYHKRQSFQQVRMQLLHCWGRGLKGVSCMQECARYLETYKIFETKPADAIQGRSEEDYLSRLSNALTAVRGVCPATRVIRTL